MPIESIQIENFISLSKECPVFDVRSPSEYLHAHIPGAFSLPIFSDEQRKVIGTAYKKESREKAVSYGLNYFSERMKSVLEEVKNILEKDSPFSEQKILLHCWRGGMRSQTMAWLLSLYGYQVFLLDGGYKSYRNWTLAQFEKKYPLKILGGYTGSGKTETLLEMKKQGLPVIDLEGIAHHKGSAFGSLGQGEQPSQEMFENILALELSAANEDAEKNQSYIWLEDESRRIGLVNIPLVFWEQMHQSPLYFLEIPVEKRLEFIVLNYGCFSVASLEESILRLKKRLGGLDTKNAIQFLSENNLHGCFEILLNYYDKMYQKGLESRNDFEKLLNKIPCDLVSENNATFFLKN